jgi:hypothetical protein
VRLLSFFMLVSLGKRKRLKNSLFEEIFPIGRLQNPHLKTSSSYWHLDSVAVSILHQNGLTNADPSCSGI